MSPARVGALAALLTFALDAGTKLGLLYGVELAAIQPVRLAPFADLIVVWNRGVSYGLFQQGSETGRWALVALALVASAGLGVWIARAEGRLLALSLGLVLGGALGNGLDRAVHGAVFDFVHLHAGGWSWYVFNVADAAIVAGVAGLLYDGLGQRSARAASPP